MEPNEIFIEIVKSDEYRATFADSPTFAKKCAGNRGEYFLAKQKEGEFTFKMSSQLIAGFGYWRNAGVTTEVSILVRIRTEVKTVKG